MSDERKKVLVEYEFIPKRIQSTLEKIDETLDPAPDDSELDLEAIDHDLFLKMDFSEVFDNTKLPRKNANINYTHKKLEQIKDALNLKYPILEHHPKVLKKPKLPVFLQNLSESEYKDFGKRWQDYKQAAEIPPLMKDCLPEVYYRLRDMYFFNVVNHRRNLQLRKLSKDLFVRLEEAIQNLDQMYRIFLIMEEKYPQILELLKDSKYVANIRKTELCLEKYWERPENIDEILNAYDIDTIIEEKKTKKNAQKTITPP